MEPADAVVLAMAAGAAARFRPNPLVKKRPEEAAYLDLQRYLTDKYPAVPADILNIGPGSAERQATLKAGLLKAGAAGDPAVTQAAARLARLVLEQNPAAAAAVYSDAASLREASNHLV